MTRSCSCLCASVGLALYLESWLLVGPSKSLEESGAHDRQTDGCVDKDFSEPAAFLGRHELAPRDRFTVGRTGKPSPMSRLGADAHAVVIAFEFHVFSGATNAQLAIWA